MGNEVIRGSHRPAGLAEDFERYVQANTDIRSVRPHTTGQERLFAPAVQEVNQPAATSGSRPVPKV
ncbi:MAG: hypothetical protein AB1646_00785 [Thermodesulfobacteriota bacterium]